MVHVVVSYQWYRTIPLSLISALKSFSLLWFSILSWGVLHFSFLNTYKCETHTNRIVIETLNFCWFTSDQKRKTPYSRYLWLMYFIHAVGITTPGGTSCTHRWAFFCHVCMCHVLRFIHEPRKIPQGKDGGDG